MSKGVYMAVPTIVEWALYKKQISSVWLGEMWWCKNDERKQKQKPDKFWAWEFAVANKRPEVRDSYIIK